MGPFLLLLLLSPLLCAGSDLDSVFLDWIVKHGGTIHPSVSISHGEFGRTLVATDAVARGEFLFSIPKKLAIRCEDRFKTPLADSFRKVDSDVMAPTYYTAALLQYEKFWNPSSFWKPYLDTLPKEFDMALYWTEEEMQMAKESVSLYATVTSNQKACQLSFDILCERFYFDSHGAFGADTPENRETLFAQYKWSLAAIITRSYGRRLEGDCENSLVPMADLMQHSPASLPLNFSMTSENELLSYIHTYHADAVAGDELVASYDGSLGRDENYSTRRTNHHWLINYGFTLPIELLSDGKQATIGKGALEMSFSFNFGMNDKSALTSIKTNLLESQGFLSDAEKQWSFGMTADNPLSGPILKALRIGQMTVSDLARTEAVRQNQPISLMNELRSLRSLKNVLQKTSSSYASTLLEDYARSLDTTLPPRQRSIYTVRAGEKIAVTKALQDISAQWLRLLDSDYSESYSFSVNGSVPP